MAIDQPVLEQVLVALGAVLASRGSIFEIVVVGGSGLLLLGLAERTTRDLDVLAIVSDGRYGSSAPLPSTTLASCLIAQSWDRRPQDTNRCAAIHRTMRPHTRFPGELEVAKVVLAPSLWRHAT